MPSRLSFALTAAPVAWIVQGLIGWSLGSRFCAGTPTMNRLVLACVGIAALTTAIAALSVGVGLWRHAPGAGTSFEHRTRFLSFGAVYVSAAFAVGIFWATLNPLIGAGCGAVR